jgi:hypothetical protein
MISAENAFVSGTVLNSILVEPDSLDRGDKTSFLTNPDWSSPYRLVS